MDLDKESYKPATTRVVATAKIEANGSMEFSQTSPPRLCTMQALYYLYSYFKLVL